MWLGLALLSVGQAQTGLWPFTALLGLPEALPSLCVVTRDPFPWSGGWLFHGERSLVSTNWLSDLSGPRA